MPEIHESQDQVSLDDVLKRAAERDSNIRMYEYTDDSGNTYWSFHRHGTMVTPATRLTLKSRLGTHVLSFLAEMRRRASRVKSLEP